MVKLLLLLARIDKTAILSTPYYLHLSPILTIPYSNSSGLMVCQFDLIILLDPICITVLFSFSSTNIGIEL